MNKTKSGKKTSVIKGDIIARRRHDHRNDCTEELLFDE